MTSNGPLRSSTHPFRGRPSHARTSAGILADLIDTAVDLHLGDLAEKLAVPHTPPTPDVGRDITARLSP